MKVAENFDLREFVSPRTWRTFGNKAIWFINPWCYKYAQFNKDFFTEHFKKEHGNQLKAVLIIINNWHYARSKPIFRQRGFRSFLYLAGLYLKKLRFAKFTLHGGGWCCAIDYNIMLVFNSGKRYYVDCDKIRDIIFENESLFMEQGLTTLEHGSIARGWIHADCRITNLNKLFIVKP